MEKVALFDSLCFYCGRYVSVDSADPESVLAKDHFAPVSRGGADKLWNIVPACTRCNRLKKDKHGNDFISERPGLCRFARKRRNRDAEISTSIYLLASRGFDIRKSLPPSGAESVQKLSEIKEVDRPNSYWSNRRQLLKQQADFLAKKRSGSVTKADLENEETA